MTGLGGEYLWSLHVLQHHPKEFWIQPQVQLSIGWLNATHHHDCHLLQAHMPAQLLVGWMKVVPYNDLGMGPKNYPISSVATKRVMETNHQTEDEW